MVRQGLLRLPLSATVLGARYSALGTEGSGGAADPDGISHRGLEWAPSVDVPEESSPCTVRPAVVAFQVPESSHPPHCYRLTPVPPRLAKTLGQSCQRSRTRRRRLAPPPCPSWWKQAEAPKRPAQWQQAHLRQRERERAGAVPVQAQQAGPSSCTPPGPEWEGAPCSGPRRATAQR